MPFCSSLWRQFQGLTSTVRSNMKLCKEPNVLNASMSFNRSLCNWSFAVFYKAIRLTSNNFGRIFNKIQSRRLKWWQNDLKTLKINRGITSLKHDNNTWLFQLPVDQEGQFTSFKDRMSGMMKVDSKMMALPEVREWYDKEYVRTGKRKCYFFIS
jgi:hypothetical protein